MPDEPTSEQPSQASAKGASGLGIASVVTGALAVICALIPLLGCVGWPLAIVGAILGGIGLFVGHKGRKLPVAGLILSLAAFPVYFIATGVAVEAGNRAEQARIQAIVDAQPEMRVSAIELRADYEANEVSADAQYKDKVVLITGVVKSVARDLMETSYVTFDSQAWNLTDVGDWDTTTINGVLQDRDHNDVHEITSVDSTPVSHDLKGNLTEDQDGQVYTWDFDNKLDSADVDGDTVVDATYAYDALGRRVSKTVDGLTQVYVCLTQQGMGQVVAEYLGGADPSADAPLRRLVYASYIDEPVVQLASDDARHYYHANRMFCVTAMTDGTGTVIERQLFTPYGELTLLEPNGSTARTASAVDFVTIGSDDYELTSLGHQGLPHDHETSLVYSRARLLDTQLGRFKGRDQMGYIDGLGLYKFVRNMPLRAWDPSGWASEQGCASQCWPPGKLQLAVTGLYVTQAGVAPEEDDKVELDIDLSKPPTSPAKATLDAIEDLAGAYAKALQFNIYLEVTLRRCENFICDGCIEVTRWSGKKKMLKQCNTGGILASGVGGTDGDETFSVVIMDQVENAVKNCMESVTP